MVAAELPCRKVSIGDMSKPFAYLAWNFQRGQQGRYYLPQIVDKVGSACNCWSHFVNDLRQPIRLSNN